MIPTDTITSVAPTAEPVDLGDVKRWLRIADTDYDYDTLLSSLITSARQKFEKDTGLALITRTCVAYCDDFPTDAIELQFPPVAAITSVTYTDGSGNSVTLPNTRYVIQTGRTGSRASLLTCFATSWPDWRPTFSALGYAEVEPQPRCVAITYTCGYGANKSYVPEEYRAAICQLAAHMFRQPEAVISGTIIALVPLSYSEMVATARVYP